MTEYRNLNHNYVKLLSNVFLFKGIDGDSLKTILENADYEIKEFKTDEKIYTPSSFEKKVGFVLKGECFVERIKGDGSSLPLNLLKENDSFGILAVFSEEESFPTQIRANRSATVAFFDEATVKFLITSYSEIAINVISFMGERISFLNRKIATFAADSVEEKMAIFLLSESKSKGSDEILLNLSKTAKVLNSGRASIYRAIASLEALELIKFENKKIYILNPNGLERITK